MVSNKTATILLGLIPPVRKWRLVGSVEHISKSMVIVAPHTSYCDAIVGKYVLAKAGVNHIALSKSELFRWPFNYVMRFYGSIPVGAKGNNSIYEVAREFRKHDNVHIVICPEGRLAKTEKWNRGFIYMAQMAEVPIVVVGLDYGRKEAIVLDIIEDVSDAQAIMKRLHSLYSGIEGCHPELFALPKIS